MCPSTCAPIYTLVYLVYMDTALARDQAHPEAFYEISRSARQTPDYLPPRECARNVIQAMILMGGDMQQVSTLQDRWKLNDLPRCTQVFIPYVVLCRLESQRCMDLLDSVIVQNKGI